MKLSQKPIERMNIEELRTQAKILNSEINFRIQKLQEIKIMRKEEQEEYESLGALFG